MALIITATSRENDLIEVIKLLESKSLPYDITVKGFEACDDEKVYLGVTDRDGEKLHIEFIHALAHGTMRLQPWETFVDNITPEFSHKFRGGQYQEVTDKLTEIFSEFLNKE